MSGLDRVIVPLPTPFTDDTSSVSEVRVARLVGYHAAWGAAGFLVGSPCGEPWTLSLSERKQMLEWTVREARGLPVYIDATASTSSAVVDLCQSADRHGARGAVYGPPSVPSPTQEETDALVRSVARYANLPTAFVGKTAEQRGHLEVNPATECAVLRQTTTEEVGLPEGTVTLLGLFGADRVADMAADWAARQLRVRALFGLAGGHRVARAAAESRGVEVGPHRPPTQGLTLSAREMLESL